MTQPTLTIADAAFDPRIMSVTDDGHISISATNSQVGIKNLILRVRSTKNALDAVF
jgi:hypothetical protein